MNKSELIATVATSADTTKATAEKVVNATFDAIKTALTKGDAVRLVGFGTFDVSERAARQGRNPQTGAVIQIKASKQPKFKAGKELKDAVN